LRPRARRLNTCTGQLLLSSGALTRRVEMDTTLPLLRSQRDRALKASFARCSRSQRITSRSLAHCCGRKPTADPASRKKSAPAEPRRNQRIRAARRLSRGRDIERDFDLVWARLVLRLAAQFRRWVLAHTEQMRRLMIEPQRVNRSDKSSRTTARDCQRLIANVAWQRIHERMPEQTLYSRRVTGDERSTKRFEIGQHDRPALFVLLTLCN